MMIKQLKHIFLFAALLLTASAAHAQTFSHYLGVGYDSYDSEGRQQAPTYHYYYYVNSSNATSGIALNLPLSGYTSSGNNYEPRGYVRWYNYDTDELSDNLQTSTSVGASLSKIYETVNSRQVCRGLFAVNPGVSICHSKHGVVYMPPSGATSETWEGENIACDFSRYADCYADGATSGTFAHEPTISIRYVFHILPAQKLANAIKDAVVNTGYTYEDGKRVSVGVRNTSATVSLRLKLNNLNQYNFYPQTSNSLKRHIYCTSETKSQYAYKESDFSSTSVTGSYTIWRVYSPDKDKYCTLSTNSSNRYINFSIANLNSASWRNLEQSSTTAPTIAIGDHVYVVCYISNGSVLAPIANWDVHFTDSYPMTISERANTYRSRDYLQATFGANELVSYSFDDLGSGLEAPTSAAENIASTPIPAAQTYYGFVYPQLTSYSKQGYCATYAPCHSEYVVVKTANLSGVSTSTENYSFGNPGFTTYDMTYNNTNGQQYGYFMFFDASDESRTVTSVSFDGNLCAGTRLIFEAEVADLTTTSAYSGNVPVERPEVMFKLYGINDDGTDQLIQSFSSGQFANNTVQTVDVGTWYQVFGQVTIPAESGITKYTSFRIDIDNMCTSTVGADYAVDDIHVYMRNSMIEVAQNNPVCPSDVEDGADAPKEMRFKIRANYESIKSLGEGSTGNKLYYRICKMDGTPLMFDYDDDDEVEDYGVITIPDSYDATATLGTKDNNHAQFEEDQYGTEFLVFANRYFNLIQGQNYYVSVSLADADGNPTAWGSPSDACSGYSEIYVIAQQNVIVSDASGTLITSVKADCEGTTLSSATITADIQTPGPVNGGTITLTGITYDWWCDYENGKSPADVYNTAGTLSVATALLHFRSVYPTRTSLSTTYSGSYTSADYNLLRTYVGDKLMLQAATSISTTVLPEEMATKGTYTVYAIPIPQTATWNGGTYDICSDCMPFTLRVTNGGATMELGFSDVTYPDKTTRVVRIGLPQLKVLALNKTRRLTIPVKSVELYDSTLPWTQATYYWRGDTYKPFYDHLEVDGTGEIYIEDTNDASFDLSTKQVMGYLSSIDTLSNKSLELKIQIDNSIVSKLKEGYWYEMSITYDEYRYQHSGIEYDYYTYYNKHWWENTGCPGETLVKFYIVPEYVTFESGVANNYNSNWNNDANWHRSKKTDIYGSDYDDSDVTGSYVPMKFTKVIIPNNKGGVYPWLSSITYNSSTGIASNLDNTKGVATDDIEYDMMCEWNYNNSNGSSDGLGNFELEKFYGNTCEQIFLKNGGEVIAQNYLNYRKAWIEKEFASNKWQLVASPLQGVYSGDFFAPKNNGKQETAAFTDIYYSESDNNRLTLPFYQRAWDTSIQEVLASGTAQAYDYTGTGIDLGAGISAMSPQWSHTFNNVTYALNSSDGASALAVKVGDDYMFTDQTSLIRLPKADTKYEYYTTDGSVRTSDVLDKDSCYRFVVGPMKTLSQTYKLKIDNSNNRYFLIGNPLASTISMYQFANVNPQLERKVWIIEDGTLNGYSLPDKGATDYKKNDILITPTQGFIVKLKDGETLSSSNNTVSFTSAMLIDRWISGADPRTSPSEDVDQLIIKAVSGERRSSATVTWRPSADNAFDDKEEVELLDTRLDQTPMVYTVASDKAVTTNMVSDINWLPLGITGTNKAAEITIERKTGNGGNLYLYDAKTRTSSLIESGETIEIAANSTGRYFITSEDINGAVEEVASEECEIRCYSPDHGLLCVAATVDGMMDEVTVFDAAGRTVGAAMVGGNTAAQFELPAGVYVVSATLTNGTVKTTKAYVR